jgi:hypothetical protein
VTARQVWRKLVPARLYRFSRSKQVVWIARDRRKPGNCYVYPFPTRPKLDRKTGRFDGYQPMKACLPEVTRLIGSLQRGSCVRVTLTVETDTYAEHEED